MKVCFQVCAGGIQVPAGRWAAVSGLHISSWQTWFRLAREVRLMQTSIRNDHPWYFFFKRQSPSHCRYHGCLLALCEMRAACDVVVTTRARAHPLRTCVSMGTHVGVTWLQQHVTWRWKKSIHWRAMKYPKMKRRSVIYCDVKKAELFSPSLFWSRLLELVLGRWF